MIANGYLYRGFLLLRIFRDHHLHTIIRETKVTPFFVTENCAFPFRGLDLIDGVFLYSSGVFSAVAFSFGSGSLKCQYLVHLGIWMLDF